MPFHLTEPHPSARRPYIQTGRGGAGNYASVPRNVTDGTTASGPASRTALLPPYSSSSSSSSSARKFTTGRGGAGNVHSNSERAIFSFDEELAHEQRLQDRAAPVYHCGRGGAGNVASEYGNWVGNKAGRQGSASSDLSLRSDDSQGRAKRSLEGAWNKVSKTFTRQ